MRKEVLVAFLIAFLAISVAQIAITSGIGSTINTQVSNKENHTVAPAPFYPKSKATISSSEEEIKNATDLGFAFNYFEKIAETNASYVRIIRDLQNKSLLHVFLVDVLVSNSTTTLVNVTHILLYYEVKSTGVSVGILRISSLIENYSSITNSSPVKIAKVIVAYNGSTPILLIAAKAPKGKCMQFFVQEYIVLQNGSLSSSTLTARYYDYDCTFEDMVVFYNGSLCLVVIIYKFWNANNPVNPFQVPLIYITFGPSIPKSEIEDFGFENSWRAYFYYDYMLSDIIVKNSEAMFVIVKQSASLEEVFATIATYDFASQSANYIYTLELSATFPITEITSLTFIKNESTLEALYVARTKTTPIVIWETRDLSGTPISNGTVDGIYMPSYIAAMQNVSKNDFSVMSIFNGVFSVYHVKISDSFEFLGYHAFNTTGVSSIISYSFDDYPNITFYAIAGETESGKSLFVGFGFKDSDRDGISDVLESTRYYTDLANPDTDGDGINDGGEIFYYGTSPILNDTDSDSLDDKSEILLGTMPLKNDTDGDGLLDGKEVSIGANPKDIDTDDDGLDDLKEVIGYNVTIVFANGSSVTIEVHPDPVNSSDTDGDGLSDADEFGRTDATSNDTDGDGLSDFEEAMIYKTSPTVQDTDGDGLLDGEEVKVYGTDPSALDSDKDGLNDSTEIFIFGTYPNASDTDGDGLSDYEETMIAGANPLKNDTDGDGLSDGEEVKIYGTSVCSNDTDGDGLSDYEEAKIYGTSPLKNDTDGDGLDDKTEILELSTNPNLVDTDGDGLPDSIELELKTNPLKNDTDGDGLSDHQETSIGTNPLKNDTDGDGLSDYKEVELGTNPLVIDTDGDGLNDTFEISLGLDPVNEDTDDDELNDGTGYMLGTNPKSSDTDGDGLSDYEEVMIKGTNPKSSDTDGDGIPDIVDWLPLTNNFHLIGILSAFLFVGAFGVYAKMTGMYKDWRKDIIMLGLSEIGGTPMFSVPEEEAARHDINLISSALYGMQSLISEISGEEQKFIVLGGKPATIISVGEISILWVIAKASYKKLEKEVKKLHKTLEEMFYDNLAGWQGIEEYLEPVKMFIKEKIFPEKIERIEKTELQVAEVVEEELEKEITVKEEELKELMGGKEEEE